MRKTIQLILLVITIFFIIGCPENIEKSDNDESNSITLIGGIEADFYLISAPTDKVTIFLVDENNFLDDRIYSYSTTSWGTTEPSLAPSKIMKAVAPPSTTYYSSYTISDIASGTYYICGEIEGSNCVTSQYGPVEIIINSSANQKVDFNP